jgi:Uma2 family endonuclease
MSTASSARPPRAEVEYPDSDGEPQAENTLQYEWITTIVGGLETLFRDDPNVFGAGDLFWYAVEGDPAARMAPDALVVFGRPKGHRGSYMQWREGGIAPQVVFEVLSPRNRPREMDRKRAWYFRFGVEEYYEFDPDRVRLRGWIGEEGEPREILPISGWTSPRLGIRFELGDGLTIFGPDDQPFLPYEEVARERDEIRHERDEARQRAERLAAKLRELGIEPGE